MLVEVSARVRVIGSLLHLLCMSATVLPPNLLSCDNRTNALMRDEIIKTYFKGAINCNPFIFLTFVAILDFFFFSMDCLSIVFLSSVGRLLFQVFFRP